MLAPLGLRLSAAKTRVVHTSDGFDFLGFRIQRRRKRGTNQWYVYTCIPDRPLKAVKEKSGHPMSVTFSPTMPLVATGGTDTTVRLWQLAFPDPPRLVAAVGYGRRINQQWARAVAFSPDGTLLATAGADRVTVLWDL
ncbi:MULTISPECIES: WD40 repeat domain-containing protein [unclassified Frankia]